MGGPSRESYRAAEEARRKRRAALRTRDGVVDLAELRAAMKAAEYLRTTHGGAPLLLGVRVVVAADVGFELEVALVQDDPRLRLCLPCAVNEVPVRVMVRNPERGAPSVSAPPVPSKP
jgi:hypothetical protein